MRGSEDIPEGAVREYVTMQRLLASFSMAIMLLVAGRGAFGAVWSQWRGNARNGLSPETQLLKSWPEGGPRLLWAVDGLGRGFSSVAVVKGMVYTTGVTAKQGYSLRLRSQREAALEDQLQQRNLPIPTPARAARRR